MCGEEEECGSLWAEGREGNGETEKGRAAGLLFAFCCTIILSRPGSEEKINENDVLEMLSHVIC